MWPSYTGQVTHYNISSTGQVTHYNVTIWAGNPLQYTITKKNPRIFQSLGRSPGTIRPREILHFSFIIGQVAQNNLIHFKKKKGVVFQITCSLCKSHMSIYCFRSFQDSKKKEILSVSTFLYKFTTQSQRKWNFSISLHRKYYKEGATVITQFWPFGF